MHERNYTNWINAYLDYSSFTEAPEHVRFWVAVSTIAGALGRKVWIDQHSFHWYANHYIVLVGPPDVISKSTTMKMGMNLLKQVPNFKMGPTACSWQALVKEMAEDMSEDWDLGDGKVTTVTPCTVSSTELGNFLKTRDPDFLDTMIALWDGDTIDKKNIKEGGSICIEHPLLNLNGCTTPSWISQNIPEHMLEGGLLSRIIFVYADKIDHPVAYPADHMPKDIIRTEGKLIEDLTAINIMKGTFTLTGEAKLWATDWYNRMKTADRSMDEKQRDRITRKQTHVHKLAMVLSAARSPDRIITLEDLAMAVKQIDALAEYRATIIASVGKSVESTLADQVCSFVKSRRQVSERDVYRRVHSQLPNVNAFIEMMNGLEKAGFLKRISLGGEIEVRWTQPKEPVSP